MARLFVTLSFLSLTVLPSCGSGSDGGGSSSEESLEVSELHALVGTCSASVGGCRVGAIGTLSDPEFDQTKWTLAFTWSLGVVAPACDAENTNDGDPYSFTYDMPFAFGATVTFRACAKNLKTGAFSEGISQTIQIPEND